MKRFQLVLGEVKEGIGASLMPALEKMATVIMDNLPIIEELGGILGEVAASVLELVAPIIQALMPALRSLMELWKTIWPLLKSILGALAPAIGNLLSGIVIAINAVIKSVTWLLQKIGLLKEEAKNAGKIGAGIGGGVKAPAPTFRPPVHLALGGPVPGPLGHPLEAVVHGGEHVVSQADMQDMVAELRAIKAVLIDQPRRQKLAMRTA